MNESRLTRVAMATMLVIFLSGVGYADDTSRYEWLTYEQDFCRSQEEPERLQGFAATLLKMIEQSDASGRKPPPGVLAEYGYFLFERGEFEAAIGYFERESGTWPPSAPLMKRMIERAKEGAGS